ncbi:replication-relaxation family protein [Saccharopolyspora rectivirgula]|uniref:replication-relaxation family protein n=1 Tax=Saccharopolyspora rectivirgula TaxID=28042 RepID=UPI00240983E8|nr:replication-relaxation family protein [Saccharopolyspora rectivirgula]
MLDPSTPQRDLRTPIPARASSRVAASTEHQATVAAHLTERDRWIARMCAEHRTLTSTQIAQVAFPSRRAANYRLQRLYQWRVLDRFQPYIGRGRAPMFYVLDTAGAHLLAHEDGLDPRELGFRAERSIGIAYSLRLAHLHGLNSLFTGLIADALAHHDRAVTAWWSEARCARHFGDIVRPDGYGRWREAGSEIEWFVEWDTGRYHLSRFVAKIPDYLELAATTRIVTPLLAVFSTASREAHARRLLTEHLRSQTRPQDLPIATTSTEELDRTGTASARVWLPLAHRDGGRFRLAELHTAWPHVGQPTSSSQATPNAREASPLPRLSPPAPIPPFARHDLTWKPTG